MLADLIAWEKENAQVGGFITYLVEGVAFILQYVDDIILFGTLLEKTVCESLNKYPD
jgi:hypothetical protein